MNVDQYLKSAQIELSAAGIDTARLDTLILLEDILGIDRSRILAEPELEISAPHVDKLDDLFKQRANHIPLAYIRGVTEFYTRSFRITPAVLEPRPESEAMIDVLKSLRDLPTEPSIADIGAGSGALGITAQLELPCSTVELIEIDPKAAHIAQTNVDILTPGVKVIVTDLLSNNENDYDVLLCNLPYVPDDFEINLAAKHEPKIALYGGVDGLDLYRKLFHQISQRVSKPLYILTESLPTQHKTLEELVAEIGYQVKSKNDFILVFSRVQK